MEPAFATPGGQRGPAEHERREQIIRAADEHFRHYGYAKTTVADLAKAIGVSAAYVYRFFESKQAIGEAVCAMTLARFDDELLGIAADSKRSAGERLRRRTTRRSVSLLTGSISRFAKPAAGRPPSARPR